MKLPSVAEIRKALVALVGGVASLITLGILHGQALTAAQAVIAAATLAGVYAAPNKPKAT